MNDRIDSITSDPARRGFSHRAKQVVAGVLVAVAATAGVASWAQGRGHGPDHGGAPMGRLLSASPEHIARGVDRVLRGLDATEAQRTQITKIVQAAALDLKGQREAGRVLREKSAALFVAPVVDAAAVESLRQQMVAQHDATSRRVSLALVDISKVLRPEQRVKLAERFKHRRDHGFGHGHHGHHGRGHEGHDAGPRGEGNSTPAAPERKPAS